MKIQDKYNTINRLTGSEPIVLELGCGKNKRIVNAVGIDAIDYDGVDIVGDVFHVLKCFPDCSVDAVYSYHFFEHIADIEELLEEIARVLKTGSSLNIVVPHFSNPYFYSDPTHRVFFGLYTFSYYSKNAFFFRQIPTYNHNLKFTIKNIDLIFKSSRPFYVRHGVKKLLGMFFNSCKYMQELYEENFCYLFPCYEISYELEKSSE